MQTLSSELRDVIEKRLRSASPKEVLTIASALCDGESVIEAPFPLTSDKAASRFETRDDIVLDRRTGLMWSRRNIAKERKCWADAKKASEECRLDGYSDWRLPTIRELLSIVDYERHKPAIDTTVFECESDWYWSSTPYAPSPGGYAWLVYFYDGYAGWNPQDSYGFVRAVRAGQFVENWF